MKATDNRFTLASDLRRFSELTGIKFDLDPCADRRSPIWGEIKNRFELQANGLACGWFGHCFVNPPFSNIEPWIDKALRELPSNVESVTFLLPANRTDQLWWRWVWAEYTDQFAMLKKRPRLSWLSPRIKFGTPEDPHGKRKKNHPPFACVLVTLWGRA